MPTHCTTTAEPFTPTAPDALWADAASRRGCWEYSRADRLQALVERVRPTMRYVTRNRADAGREGNQAEVGRLDARLAVLTRRHKRLCRLASEARRAESRAYDFRAAECAAVDSLCRGYDAADLVDDMLACGACG